MSFSLSDLPDAVQDNYLIHHEEPLSPHQAIAAKAIAENLLARGGWTGSQIDGLERLAAMQADDPDALEWVENLRDARDREEALK